MIYQIGDNLPFQFAYIKDQVGATGLTVTLKAIYCNGVAIGALSGAVVTELGDGLYEYILNGDDYVTTAGRYTAIATTADADVYQRDLYAINVIPDWVGYLDRALSALPAAVWSSTERTLTSFGTLATSIAAAVWRYARRGLTMTPTELIYLLTQKTWILYRGTTWDADVELNVNLSGLDEDGDIWFTYKRKPETEDDDDALLQISYHNGLTRLNGAAVAAEDSSLGAIAMVDEIDGTVHLYVSETITAQLELMTRGYFDFKVRLSGESNNVRLYADGQLRVYRDVTRTV